MICPEWCTQHRATEHGPGETVESCNGSLYVQRLSMSEETSRFVFHLYVSAYTVTGAGPLNGGSGPALALVEDRGPDSMARGMSPEQAREMADALIRGAEIVEASRTAVCANCGAASHPLDLYTEDGDIAESGGQCLTCWSDARRRAMAERRSRLHLI